MKKGAEVPGAKSQDEETRPHLKQYLEKGYCPASIQLEYTSADFAIAQFAVRACGDEFASWRYFHFARSWKNLWNPETGWLCSRNEDGSWKNQGDDWREATYKDYFWMVPYNIKGLIDLVGGKAVRLLKGDYAQEISVTPVYNVYGTEVKGEPSTATLTNEPLGMAILIR